MQRPGKGRSRVDVRMNEKCCRREGVKGQSVGLDQKFSSVGRKIGKKKGFKHKPTK